MTADRTPLHPELAAGRWYELSLMEQLANIGSEVHRAISADGRRLTQRRDAAIDRALELFDLTAADPRWRGHRVREILRARELFCTLFFGDDPEPGTAEFLQRYFHHFTYAAQLERGKIT